MSPDIPKDSSQPHGISRRLSPLSDLAGIIGAAENLNDQAICNRAMLFLKFLTYFGGPIPWMIEALCSPSKYEAE